MQSTTRTFLFLGASGLIAAVAWVAGASTSRATTAAPDRVFELRTYTTHPGRLDALNKRFREHTTALFKKHGMENIGYWTPADDKDGKGDTLIYLIAHSSRDAAKKSWAAFGADLEWQKASKASEEDGKIVKEVKSVFLNPTDYSELK